MRTQKRLAPGFLAFVLLTIQAITRPLFAQDAPSGYQTPPNPLANLINVLPTPSVSVSEKGDYLLLMERAANPTIAELSQPELKLAGLRMNPANNGPSRQNYITGLKIKKLTTAWADAETLITGLPTGQTLQIGNVN